MCADLEVMRHFPAPLSLKETESFIEKITLELNSKPYGLWAVELNTTFIGYVGLHEATFEAPFTPAVEIGWRIAKEHWRQGYAFEAAQTVLEYAKTLDLSPIYSFTIPENLPSINLMKKLGMQYQGTFNRPNLPPKFEKHVLYAI